MPEQDHGQGPGLKPAEFVMRVGRVVGPVMLFAVPVNLKKGEFALDWETAKGLPWGILLLFGGGLSPVATHQSKAAHAFK